MEKVLVNEKMILKENKLLIIDPCYLDNEKYLNIIKRNNIFGNLKFSSNNDLDDYGLGFIIDTTDEVNVNISEVYEEEFDNKWTKIIIENIYDKDISNVISKVHDVGYVCVDSCKLVLGSPDYFLNNIKVSGSENLIKNIRLVIKEDNVELLNLIENNFNNIKSYNFTRKEIIFNDKTKKRNIIEHCYKRMSFKTSDFESECLLNNLIKKYNIENEVFEETSYRVMSYVNGCGKFNLNNHIDLFGIKIDSSWGDGIYTISHYYNEDNILLKTEIIF